MTDQRQKSSNGLGRQPPARDDGPMPADSDRMRITRLTVKNWRNFKSIDLQLQRRVVVVGPNAVGKSNLLDAVRFLAEIAATGGGLAAALQRRGGLRGARFLNARNYNHGRVELALSLGDDESPDRWRYELQFTGERNGSRPVVYSERVLDNGQEVLNRPEIDDKADPERLTQTALEQVARNQAFRPISHFLGGVRYLHLVPQLIRDPERAQAVTADPFGTDFLDQIATTNKRELQRRMRVMREALQIAVPQLDNLDLERDPTGRPHLAARYSHWRQNAAKQDERDFSDGTLRLIGLLWSLLEVRDRTGVILLEEPELSLHGAIASRLPAMLARAQAGGGSQIMITTHSADLLADEGLGLDEVVLLLPGDEGAEAVLMSDDVDAELVTSEALTLPEAVRARTAPASVGDLATAI